MSDVEKQNKIIEFSGLAIGVSLEKNKAWSNWFLSKSDFSITYPDGVVWRNPNPEENIDRWSLFRQNQDSVISVIELPGCILVSRKGHPTIRHEGQRIRTNNPEWGYKSGKPVFIELLPPCVS